MGLSVRQLKEQLTAHGVDFSTCFEKTDLERLLADAKSRASAAPGAASPDAAGAPGALEHGGYARCAADGRHCWVEFVDDGDALCIFADGSDRIIPEVELGQIESLPKPLTFGGSFEAARSEAFHSGRLLVAAVCEDGGSKLERLQTLMLAAEEVISLINSNAVFWRGAPTELRAPHMQQLAPNGAIPSVCMILPLATDAMRVVSHSQQDDCDSFAARFVQALEEFDEHTRQKQERLLNESALLRMEQDEEFAASLAADQAAEQAVDAAPAQETATLADSQAEESAIERQRSAATRSAPAFDEQLAKKRRIFAEEFLADSPDAGELNGPTARLVLRLPSGQRVQRTFSAQDKLARVRRWAACCPWLPEAPSQDLLIPAEFNLSMAFPRRQFTQEDDESTLAELGLAPNAALLLTDASS